MYKGELGSWISANAENKLFDVILTSEVSGLSRGFMMPALTCAEVVEVITLPNKDVIFGFKMLGKTGNIPKDSIYYYKLSEIRLIDQTQYYLRLAEEQRKQSEEGEKEDGDKEGS